MITRRLAEERKRCLGRKDSEGGTRLEVERWFDNGIRQKGKEWDLDQCVQQCGHVENAMFSIFQLYSSSDYFKGTIVEEIFPARTFAI